MRNSQNHKKTVNFFLNGADHDINADLASLKQGFYKDAKNMRLLSNNGTLQRIYGETLKYYTAIKDFSCIGALEVNGCVVEVWVSDNVDETNGILGTVRFRIDGVVMVETSTSNLKFIRTRKLQMDKADDCKEGLFALTDNYDVPYLFSLKDIQDNYTTGTGVYTTLFNPALYSINLTNYPNIPVFRKLVTDGALLVGKYAYAIRFVDKDDNRTKFGIPTPMIPVPMLYDAGADTYPYSRTYGGSVGETSPYGIKLQFRINNILNYKYIELLRIKSVTGQALNETQEAEYRPLTPELIDGEVSVRTFIDDGSYNDWIEFTDDESTDTMAAIERCKSVRYYNNQLVLGNIKVASRDLTDTITFTEYLGEKAFPVVENLEEEGYYSPYNTAYKASYMGGEKYGFGVACFDSQGNVAFVLPIKDDTVDFTNYQFPDRREPVQGASYDISISRGDGAPKAADINNNPGKYVYEKFVKGTEYKTAGSKYIGNSSYNPYTPKYYNDSVYSGLNYAPNTIVSTIAENTLLNNQIPSANKYVYKPNFGLTYYGMGIAISGIENLPSWITSFCVVRTKAAGYVKCQGIAAYEMTDSPQAKSTINSTGLYNSVSKSLDTVAFHSDDIKQGFAGVYDDNTLLLNKFLPVSPLGYFSEIYSGRKDYLSGGYRMYDNSIDAILYAREFVTNANFPTSPYLFNKENDILYWTKFGVWRNAIADVTPDPTLSFGILADSSVSFKNQGLEEYVKIKLDAPIYKHANPAGLVSGYGSQMNCNDGATKDFHEPFYIANIIDEAKDVPSLNQEEYLLTGHYQKIQAKIGEGNNFEQTIPLLDERWEDCSVNKYYADRPTYIYIKDKQTGVEQAWLDVTIYNPRTSAYLTNIVSSLTANEYYDSTDPYTLETVRCYGVYDSFWDTTDVNEGNVNIHFGKVTNLDQKYSIPRENTEIIVKYDKRFPIRVFGGDTYIGESIFSLVDGQSNANGDVSNNNQLYAWVGLPYSAYDISTQLRDASLPNDNQTWNFVCSNIYRQIAVSSIVETRCHLPYSFQEKGSTTYSYNNNFPRTHYIIRPLKWTNSNIGTDNFAAGGGGIADQYNTDYPQEYLLWSRGGFRIRQFTNIDYSKANNYNVLFGKPVVGFEEKTEFCTRIIWSLKRNINVQGDPNLKTFLTLNAYDISDRNGEIKFLYDNDSQKGNNLIALTDSGICLLITDKRQISDYNANELFVMDADKLIAGEYWLSKVVGSSGEFWRGIAEYNNMLFFPNSESVYLLAGLELKDILRINKGSYYEKLHPVLQAVTNAIQMTGVYNIDNQEYWLYIGDTTITSPYEGSDTIDGVDSDIITPKKLIFGDITYYDSVPRTSIAKEYDGETYVYKLDKEVFTGRFDYRGDKFLCVQGSNTAKNLTVLLMKNYETYETNLGANINGSAIEGELEYVVSPEGYIFKEFIDKTFNISLEPTSVDLRNTGTTAEATQTFFKDYGNAYYMMTPRKTTNGNRFQGRALIVTLKNSTSGLFEVVSVETGYKIIK